MQGKSAVYLDGSLQLKKELLLTQQGQAEDLGFFGAASAITDQVVELEDEIAKSERAIALEGLPLSLGSYAMGQKL
jgi:hypothetical protein